MTTESFTSPEGRRIAFRRAVAPAGGVTFVWLCGFKSDMSGSKARAVEAWAREAGYGTLLFDYSGHGQSGGAFEDGTISAWRADTLAAIDALTLGPLVLVGSSMGGWMALLAAMARPERVRGLLLIAPAPDFTEKLMWPEFMPAQQAEILVGKDRAGAIFRAGFGGVFVGAHGRCPWMVGSDQAANWFIVLCAPPAFKAASPAKASL